MRILQIVAIAVLGASLAMVIRPYRPEMALLTAIATGMIALIAILGDLTGVIDSLRDAAARYGVDTGVLGVLIKIVGMAYLAEIGARICADAGESAIAAKVELCGRVLILAAAMPALLSVLSAAAGLLQAAAP